jgi:LacI family transcriptional regulator
MKSVSIKDIANQVGVSTTTVSFVLNGKAKEKRISEDLKNEILRIAAQLNYRPNQVARGLRTGQTHTLGLIIEDISNPFFGNLAKVVEEEADKHGYSVMFCSTDNLEHRASGLLSILKHRQMDGFLITPTPGLREDVSRLVEEQRPLVLIDRYFPGLETSYVAVDNYQGAFDATNYLLGKGYKRIALVTTASTQVQMQNRQRGYTAALAAAGMMADDELTLKVGFDLSPQQAVSAISGFITQTKPDAVFFTTNYLGVYGLESLRISGVTIPADMGIVCFDDHDLFRLGKPAVTVVAQPIHAIAVQAVESLIEQLQTKHETQMLRKVLLEPALIVRDT